MLCLGVWGRFTSTKIDSYASQEAGIVILPSCVSDIKGGRDDEVWSCLVEEKHDPGVKGI